MDLAAFLWIRVTNICMFISDLCLWERCNLLRSSVEDKAQSPAGSVQDGGLCWKKIQRREVERVAKFRSWTWRIHGSSSMTSQLHKHQDKACPVMSCSKLSFQSIEGCGRVQQSLDNTMLVGLLFYLLFTFWWAQNFTIGLILYSYSFLILFFFLTGTQYSRLLVSWQTWKFRGTWVFPRFADKVYQWETEPIWLAAHILKIQCPFFKSFLNIWLRWLPVKGSYPL